MALSLFPQISMTVFFCTSNLLAFVGCNPERTKKLSCHGVAKVPCSALNIILMVVPNKNTRAFYWSIFAVEGVIFDLFKNFI